jgi:hypothetical protein
MILTGGTGILGIRLGLEVLEEIRYTRSAWQKGTENDLRVFSSVK